MAQLAFAAGGAVIGSFFGAPGLGWAAGAIAGGLLFPPKPKTSQPLILANTANSSSYGQPIPLAYGTAKVSANNRIWQSKFKVVTSSQSAKGLGGPTATTQTVFGSCAWGVCVGPIQSFGRIWANGNLIVTPAGSVKVSALTIANAGTGGVPGPATVVGTTGTGSPHYTVAVTIGGGGGITSVGKIINAGYYTSAPTSPDPVNDISGTGLTGATLNVTTKALPVSKFAKYFTYYLGTEVQLPDPTIEATEGAGNVPGYRGLAYIVATNMPLARFGNGYPNLEVEVNGIMGAGAGSSIESLTWGSDRGANIALSNANLRAKITGAGPESVLTTDVVPPGVKVYCEFTMPAGTGSVGGYGPVIGPFNPPAPDIASLFDNNSFGYENSGLVGRMITPPAGWPTGFGGYGLIDTWVAGDTIGMAIDTTGGSAHWWFRVIHSGTAQAWNDSDDVGLPSDPAAGTNPFVGGASSTGVFLAGTVNGSGDVVANFGPIFKAAAPTGFGATVSLTLADMVSDVCERGGLTNTVDFDATALATQDIRGVVFAQQMSGRQIINAAMTDFFFLGVQEDDIIRWKFRGGASLATIPEDDLAARSNTTERPKVTDTRRDDIDMPRQVYYTYIDLDLEYQQGAQVSPRLAEAMGSRDLQHVDSVFVHNRTEGVQIAQKTLFVQWNGRTDFAFSLPPKYRKYSPADVITIVYGNGTIQADVELTSSTFGADLVIDLAGISADAPSFLAGPSLGPGNTNPGQDAPEEEVTTLLMLDLPLLTAGDDSMGYYATMRGTDLQWSGASLVKSSDDVNFAQVGASTVPAVTGLTTTVLADRLTWAWDRTSTVNVQLDEADESLASVAETDVLNQLNIFMVGSEMIGAATATMLSPGLYQLSDLVRGLQGTDWATGTHGIGERVVKLARDTSIVSVSAPLAEFNVQRFFRGVSTGELISTAPDVLFTPAAIRIKPISPFVDPAKASRDGSNNLLLPFTPRSRLIAGWYTTAPDESQGIFQADVIFPLSPRTVARTITNVASANGSMISAIDPTGLTVTYKAADQTLDGITPGNVVTFDIYQMSARIGALTGYKTAIAA